MVKSEVACLLSHRAIYQIMVDRNIDKAIILEDDAQLLTDFHRIINTLIELPIHWDMIRFKPGEKMYGKGRYITSLFGSYQLVRFAKLKCNAICYMLTRQAALRLIKHTSKISMPIDFLQGYVWRTGLNIYSVCPDLAYGRNTPSTIESLRFNKTVQLTGWRRLVYPATRLYQKLSEALNSRFFHLLNWPRDIFNCIKLK